MPTSHEAELEGLYGLAEEVPIFATLGELQDRPELLLPPECVVPRLAYRGRFVILAGPDKSGKSTLMGHAIAALSNRDSFLGATLGARHRRALLVGLEEALGDGVRRLTDLGADRGGVKLLTMPQVDLLERTRDLLADWPVDLVVIDSLQAYARATLGKVPDDGDNSGWSDVVRPLADLAHETETALVVLHHVRRSDGTYRGAGEIAATADALLELVLPGPSEDPTMRRVRGRGRWAVEPFTLTLRADGYELGGGALSVDAQVLLAVRQAGEEGVSTTALRSTISARAATVDAAINRLRDAREVTRGPDRRYRLPDPPLPF